MGADARGVEPRCHGVRLRAAPELAPEWRDAVDQVTHQIPAVGDEACASITILVEPARDGGVRLEAMAADGRFTERTITRAVDLPATLLGIVTTIPDESTTPMPPLVASPAPAAQTPAAPLAPPPAATPKSPPPPRIEVRLGAAVGARVGEPLVEMIDMEGRADAIVGDWLLAVSFRYAPSIGPDLSDWTYEEIALGLGAGRRFPLGRGSLDLTVLPSVVAMNVQWNNDTPKPESDGWTAFRVGLLARWSMRLNESWFLTVTADADVSPSAVSHPLTIAPDVVEDAPTLPAWTIGLRMGASGSLL